MRFRTIALSAAALSLNAFFAGCADNSAHGNGKLEAAGPYVVSRVMHIGGEGRWDYVAVDPASRRLYVPRQTHTQIISADSGKVVADIKDTAGVHGVALVLSAKRGFTSNGQSNSSTVFDLDTNEKIGAVVTGQKPDCIIYDPSSGKVLAFNGKSHDVTVIDPSADPLKAAVSRIPLDGGPEYAVADGAGRVYVNLEDKDSVAVIDTKAMQVTATWKIDGGEEPSGLAIDTTNGRLFCGCHNKVMAILDTATGKTLARLPIGKGVDACEFDASTGEAFASCGDGTLTIGRETSPGKFEVTQTVATHAGARTMALDPTTHTIYLPAAEYPAQSAPAEGRPTPKPDSFEIVVVTPAPKKQQP